MMSRQAGARPVPTPLRDVVLRLRAGAEQADHAAYFGKLLGDVTEATAPFGILDVRGDGTTVTEARTALDAGVAAAVRQRARALEVSPATLFHVAYARLVGFLAGRDDVVFGTVLSWSMAPGLSGRIAPGPGAYRAPGLFRNTLPVRARVSAVTALDAVRDMRVQLTRLRMHEAAPLSAAEQASGVAPGTPLFTAVLNYGRSAPADAGLFGTRRGGFDGTGLPLSAERTSYPLVVAINDTGKGLAITARAVAPVRPRDVCHWLATAVAGLADELAAVPAVAGAPGVRPGISRRRVTSRPGCARPRQGSAATWAAYPSPEP